MRLRRRPGRQDRCSAPAAGISPSLRRRYLASLALLAAGLLGSATVAALPAALASFAVTGAGNGLFVVSDRILLQRAVAERFHGRAFGLLDAFGAWGFAGATLAGGALVAAAGARVTFAVAGAGALAVLLITARVLADRRSPHAVAPVLNPQMSLNANPRGARDGLEVVTSRDLSLRPKEPSVPWRRGLTAPR